MKDSRPRTKKRTVTKSKSTIYVPQVTTIIPEGFYLIIDTREQLPLFDNPSKELEDRIIRKALPYGDYSVKGFETLIFAERKKISDLVPYVTTNLLETINKLKGCERARGYLTIEAKESQVLQWHDHTDVSPQAIRGGLAALESIYHLSTYYTPNRTQMERWILDRFIKFYTFMRSDKISPLELANEKIR